MTYQFPPHFLWGSSTSAAQAEGAAERKQPSIWDYWYQQNPELFFDRVGPSVTSDFFHTFKEDIALMKKLGHTAFRTSIGWSRLFDDPEKGVINKEALQFYNTMIDLLLANNIEPMLCLFHFDMPLSLQQKGGWESKEVVRLFARYAATAFHLFGDRVKKWFTFNEPVVVVEGGYLYQFHYPCVTDFKRAAQVVYHINLASALAVQEFKKAKLHGDIGMIINLTPSYPRSTTNKEDVEAAFKADLIFNRSFLDPAVKGSFPPELIALLREYQLMPDYTDEELQIINDNRISLLGVNYYQPRRIKKKESVPPDQSLVMPHTFFDDYDKPDKRMNPYRGWEIYPEGLYDIARNIKDNYGNIPWMVTENGMGVAEEEHFIVNGEVEDNYRIEFIQDHLKALHRGISEGSNCLGYLTWTFIDCWSWLNAYKNRYGFVRYNLDDGKKSIKKSGYWFRDMIHKNGFTAH